MITNTKTTMINLNLLTDVIDAFIEEQGVSLNGKALIALFGQGDEEDNWEALLDFIGRVNGKTVVSKENLLQLLRNHIKSHLSRMRTPNFQVDKRCLNNLYGYLSRSECQTLALGMTFLVEQEISRQKTLCISMPDQLWMLDNLNRWDRNLAYQYCLTRLVNKDIRFQKNPAWLLPILVNRFYQHAVLPWIARGRDISQPVCQAKNSDQ